jgi:hypothetical protein
MDTTTVIIDDFLPNPDLVREQVIQLPFHEHEGEYPGMRSDAADGNYQQFFQQRITEILNVRVKEFVYDSFCFQLVYEGAKTWIHKDGCDWAGVLYLTPNAMLDSGTALYDEDNNPITTISNVYNRLILYKGNINHSSMVPGFGNSPETGRLTQVFFFNAESTIQGMI